MAVTRERFAAGLTYDQFKSQMTRNRERLEEIERKLEFDASDLLPFKALPQPLDVLVIAEDWCGDVIANLPILARLAADTGKLNLRLFRRDENLDLMDQYLKEGKYRSIPVFVFFDEQFREIGRFVERPASVTELRARRRREIYAEHPEFGSPDEPVDRLPEEVRIRLSQELARMREETAAFAQAEVVRELLAIVGHYRASRQPSPGRSGAKPAVARRPVKVSITYCASCGYEPQTLALAGALMSEFQHDLASIEIIPGEEGAFDVSVGGELVHSMYRDGGFPEHEAIASAVRARLTAGD